jgi:hypothetical protein
MADCLYAMTVGIQHEGGVIVSVMVRSQPWCAIVAASSGNSCHIKGVDRRAVGSAEAEVRAGNGGRHIGFAGDGEFYAERAGTAP